MNPTALNTSAFLPKNKTHSQDEMLVGSLNIAFILEEEKRGGGVGFRFRNRIPYPQCVTYDISGNEGTKGKSLLSFRSWSHRK